MKKQFLLLFFAVNVMSDITERDDVQTFIDNTAETTILTREEVKNFLIDVEFVERVIELRNNQPETTFSWNRYRNIFLNPQRVNKGKAFVDKNFALLDKIENDLGVSKFYIAAIVGAETTYGTNLGGFNPLDTISTLAFEIGSSFWQRELKELLLLAKKQNINPKNYKSSWAGAIGIGQFIPSSYMAYGIDYDGDQKVDLVNSLDDGLASVANYLNVHGWSEDATTILEISLNEQFRDLKDNQIKEIDLPFKVNNFNTSIPFNILQSSDLSNEEYEGQATPLLVYEGTTTKLFLGFDNFGVITKYNRSSFYALAIHQLAMAISEKFDD